MVTEAKEAGEGRGMETNEGNWAFLKRFPTIPTPPPFLTSTCVCACQIANWIGSEVFLRKLQHHILSSYIWLYINTVATVFTTCTVQLVSIQYNRKQTRPRLQRTRFFKTIIELTFCYYSCYDRMLAGFESCKEIFAISPKQTDLNAERKK